MPLPETEHINYSRTMERQSRPEVVRGSVVASWAEKLRAEGLPEELIDYMKKAEFEAWVQQHHHKIGDGLFYSDEFQDLPPRFKKKIIDIAVQISEGIASKEDFISMITKQPSSFLPKGKNDDSDIPKSNNHSDQPLSKPHPKFENGHIHAPHCIRKENRNFDHGPSHNSSASNECPQSKSQYTSQTSSRKQEFTNSKIKVNNLSHGKQAQTRHASNDRNNIPVENQSLVFSENSRTKVPCNKQPNNNRKSVRETNRNDHSGVPVNERTNNRATSSSSFTDYDSSSDNFHRKPSRGRKNDYHTGTDSHRGNDKFKNDNKNTSFPLSRQSSSSSNKSGYQKPLQQRWSPSSSSITSSTDSCHSTDVKNPENVNSSSLISKDLTGHSIIEVIVSDCVEDIAYWKNYVSFRIASQDFKFLSFSISGNSIQIAFPSALQAKHASRILKEQRNNNNSPFIRRVSGVRSINVDKLKKCTPADKISCENTAAVEALYDRQIKNHFQRIKVVNDEFKQLQKGGSKNRLSLKAVNDQKKSLSEMEDVFTLYYNKIVEQLKTVAVDKNVIEKVNQLKNLFMHECNFLDGCLPIYAKKSYILEKIATNQVTVVVADTGSGKSTQLVQYLSHEGYSKKGTIVCTQPRKVAAVSLCEYISRQMGSVTGQLVGYETGSRSKTSSFTKICFMTDYTLLRKCCNENEINKISCIIVDEAHERSLYTDLLLGMLKRILSVHPDLKLVITSATIDPETFLSFFGCTSDAAINVPGRMYPVEILYQNDKAYIGWDYLSACVKCVHNIHKHHKEGGILVFLTSPAETEEAKYMLEKILFGFKNQTSVFALHGKQELQDQLLVFEEKDNRRKIIFATNSAETSLTIPGIKFIVDCGMSKQLYYDRNRKRSALVVDFISRSSANQRKGRAGRTQPGYCYRMYTEENYKEMVEDTAPEILRAPLLEALVQILELNIHPEKFDYISSPPKAFIRDSMQSLQHLGAVKGHQLTALGKKIAKFSLPPQLAKLIVEAHTADLTFEAIVLVSMIKVSSRVFIRTDDNKKEADQQKVKFCHKNGDLLTLLTVYHEWSVTDYVKKKEWCDYHYINGKAMTTATNLIKEYTDTFLYQVKHERSIERRLMPTTKFLELYDRLESILFSCFSENLFTFSGHARAGYLSPFHDGSFFIHPSSAIAYLQEQPPAFIICTDILKTSRNFLVNIVPVSEITITAACQDDTFDFPVDLIKALKVVPKVFRPVGELVLRRHIIGKDGTNIKAIEEEVRFLTKSQTFYLEVNVQKGEVVIFVEEQFLKSVTVIIAKAIDAARNILGKEESCKSTGTKDYNFVLGRGGLIHDVILPGESREVTVSQTQRNFNADQILKELRRFGSIISHSEIIPSSPTVNVIFKNVDSAEKAIKALQTVKDLHIRQGNVSIPARIKDNPSLFEIEVTWSRLYCNGSGCITFEDSQARIEAGFKLIAHPLYIDKKYIVVDASPRNANQLCMRNLPENVEREDVKTALCNTLPSHLHMCDVTLNRKAPFESSQTDLTIQKTRLNNSFAPFAAKANDIFVDLKHPERKDKLWKAIISFTNFEDGKKAMSCLSDNIRIGEHKPKLTLILKFVTYCKHYIFRVLEESIQECEQKFKNINKSTKVSKNFGKERVAITATCDDVRILSELRKELNAIMQGRHIKCHNNEKLMKLFSQNSFGSFEEIEHATRTIIFCDTVRKVITIFGSKSKVDEAEQLITNCANTRSVIKKTRVFDLLGRGMPKGFTKMLYTKYEYSLKGLRKSYKLDAAHLDFAKHQLILEGSLEKINRAEEHLERLCEELHEMNETRKKSEEADAEEREVCPVCLDVITFADSIRLENCGHSICKPCLYLQIQSEVFPVVCVKEDCNLPFFVEDFRKIFCNEPPLSPPFLEAALKYFLTQNANSVRYCPMPNCLMVYRPNKGQIICQGCCNDICTRCHCLYHHGMTCDMYRETRLDEDYPLKVWQQCDSQNRKSCPSCSMPIEKDGGCNHMTCANCKQHICWLCLQIFKVDKDVYRHFSSCPANM